MARNVKRITYVEDDPDIRAVAQLALEEVGGFVLNMCDSGRAAIDTAPDFGPDVVLLDVMMPGMDGIQTFDALRKLPALRDALFVFVTAKAQSHEIDEFMALGADDVIPKPFNAITLADEVRAIWERARPGSKE
jgi:CheY-like chemotaxis protein